MQHFVSQMVERRNIRKKKKKCFETRRAKAAKNTSHEYWGVCKPRVDDIFCYWRFSVSLPPPKKTSSGPVVQCHPRALAFIANPFLTLRDSCNGLERKFYRPSNGLPIPPLLHALAPSLSRIFSRASCLFSYDCVTSFCFVSFITLSPIFLRWP